MFIKILVIYNKRLNKDYIQNYRKDGSLLIICDNSDDSDIKVENVQKSKEVDIRYIDMDGNRGLAKAYNRAISSINYSENDWFIILDQDTEINELLIEAYKHSIFVRQADGLLSAKRSYACRNPRSIDYFYTTRPSCVQGTFWYRRMA